MDPECESQFDFPDPSTPHGGGNNGEAQSEDMTKDTNNNIPLENLNTPRTDNSVQKIGLIVGIVAVVLIAIIILIIALYKFHRRDEGTYKVDESQNFAYMEAKKQNGNGVFIGPTPGQVKPGKKKDVKEWYV